LGVSPAFGLATLNDLDVPFEEERPTLRLPDPLGGLKNMFSGPEEASEARKAEMVKEIANFRPQVLWILRKLKDGSFSGQEDDAVAVAMTATMQYKKMQKKMEEYAPEIAKSLERKDGERLKVLPDLMTGHILELFQAVSMAVGVVPLFLFLSPRN